MQGKKSLFSYYTDKTADHVVSTFQSSLANGLSSAQVAQQKQRYGINHVDTDAMRSLWSIYVDQFRSPFIYLLTIVTLISMLMGNILDGVIILIVLIYIFTKYILPRFVRIFISRIYINKL